METYIQISKLNDYLFCPRSLYFHSIYENFSEKTYHSYKQIVGKICHESIEKISYSTKKDMLQDMPIYNSEYNLMGKIDLFDQKTGELVERKYQIKKIYKGQKIQLYAQYLCLTEMGFNVKKIFLYSLRDNKKYQISIPARADLLDFKNIINKINNQGSDFTKIKINKNKCNNCIYHSLCNT